MKKPHLSLLTLLALLTASLSFAEEPAPDQYIHNMRMYVEAERQRKSEIKLLNLDIEKFDLELRKKELQQKIKSLNHVHTSGLTTTYDELTKSTHHDKKETEILVNYVSVSPDYKEALVLIDGMKSLVQEGEKLSNGYLVNAINEEGVVLSSPSGENVNVQLSKAGE